MSDVRQVLVDPDFLSLSPVEQRSFLVSLDPDFSALSEQDFSRLVGPQRKPTTKAIRDLEQRLDPSAASRITNNLLPSAFDFLGMIPSGLRGPEPVPTGGTRKSTSIWTGKPLEFPEYAPPSLPDPFEMISGAIETLSDLPEAFVSDPVGMTATAVSPFSQAGRGALRGAAAGARANPPKFGHATGGGLLGTLLGHAAGHDPFVSAGLGGAAATIPTVAGALKGGVRGFVDAIRPGSVPPPLPPMPPPLPAMPPPLPKNPRAPLWKAAGTTGGDVVPALERPASVAPAQPPVPTAAIPPVSPVQSPTHLTDVAMGSRSNVNPIKHTATHTDLIKQSHAVAQDLELPGSPAGKNGHPSLSKAAKDVYGVKSYSELSYEQALALHEYMLKHKKLPTGPRDLLP